jgi:Tfp pilus assembly protein PilF
MFADMGRTTRNSSQAASVLQRLGSSVWIYAVIAVLAGIVYAQTLDFSIDKFDEDLILKANIDFLVKKATVADVLMRDAFFRSPGKIFYRPVQNVSFLIDATIGNGKASTFYATNILLHMLASVLMFRVLLLITKRPDVSVLTAVFFTLNPLFVQAIAWTPGRGDLLLAVFSMLALLTMHAYMTSGSARSLVFYAASVLLAVFSKETAAVLTVLLPISWLLLQPRTADTWRRIGITSAIAVGAVGLLLYLRTIVNTDPPAFDSFEIQNFLENLRVFSEIIGKLFVPTLLQPMAGYTVLATALGGLVMLGLVAAAWFSEEPRARMVIVVGLAWYAAFMLPGSMYTHRFGSFAYDYLEHRGYASSIGIMLIIALAAARMVRALPPAAITGTMALMVVGYGAMAMRHVDDFATPMTFYNRSVETNPASGLARTNRGQLRQQARDEAGAIDDYRAVIRDHPGYALPRLVLGGIYQQRRQHDSALVQFRQALAADSSIPQSALFMGHAYIGKNMVDSARYWYAYVVRREPKNFDGLLNLGVAESKLGDWVGARARFSAAINVMPTNNLGWLNRGVANQQLGDVAAACADWQRATSFGSKQAQDYVARFCGGQNAPVP